MFDNGQVRLGIAPIAWTNDDMPELGSENTFEQCVSEMALAGFTGSEIGSKYPREPDALKKALALRKIQICNAWFSTFFTTRLMEETVDAFIKQRDFLYEMGARMIGVAEQGHSIQGRIEVPVFEEKPVFTHEEWEKLTKGLGVLAKLAEDKGMQVSYHHHMGTGVQTPEEIDRLMSSTDREKVHLLFDTGHLAFMGENPVEVLKKHIGRVKHVHLKDVRKDVLCRVRQEKMSFLQAVKAGAFTVPGDGTIDFEPVFDMLSRKSYKGWMVVEAEQDPALANPLEYAIKARAYIAEKTGL
jgi:Sugar phosphate isomerases/epimerases